MSGFGWQELLVVGIIVVALFGWKKMPDMARSLGRSARIFKSEVDEMKKDGKGTSEAAQATVKTDAIDPETARREAEAKAAEAEAKAAEARAEADRLRGDATL